MVEISIIVPVYNVDRYLKRCLNSILEQSFENYEVILIDDGSSDYSGQICDEYAQEYNNFIVVHKANKGLGFARNSGLDIAQGRYVTFLDSDDYIEPNHLKNMYDFLKENKSDTCLSGYTRTFTNDRIVQKYSLDKRIFLGKDIITNILPRMCGKKNDHTDFIEMSVCMILFSNSIIQNNHLRFCSEQKFISEDLIFNFDYFPLAKSVCIADDAGYCYCDNEGSLTTRYRQDRFEAQKVLYEELLNKTYKLHITETCKSRIETTFIDIVRYCIKLEVKYRRINGYSNAYKKIKHICNDTIVAEILDEYDNSQTPIKSRYINMLIKHKKICALWLIELLRVKISI